MNSADEREYGFGWRDGEFAAEMSNVSGTRFDDKSAAYVAGFRDGVSSYNRQHLADNA